MSDEIRDTSDASPSRRTAEKVAGLVELAGKGGGPYLCAVPAEQAEKLADLAANGVVIEVIRHGMDPAMRTLRVKRSCQRSAISGQPKNVEPQRSRRAQRNSLAER